MRSRLIDFESYLLNNMDNLTTESAKGAEEEKREMIAIFNF
jgi:hypothetical protein